MVTVAVVEEVIGLWEYFEDSTLRTSDRLDVRKEERGKSSESPRFSAVASRQMIGPFTDMGKMVSVR